MTGTVCIVLAGGLGTRLRSVLAETPKCLAPVRGKPFLQWQLESLAARGVDRFVLSLGHLAGQVEAAAATWPLADRIDCVVEPQPLGTGGAIAFAMAERGLEEALVANGDTFLGGDLGAMLRPLAPAQGEAARMSLVQVPDRSRFGGVELDAEGRVQRFVEKGRQGAGAINAGFYRLRRDTLLVPDRAAFSLETDILPVLAQRQALFATAIDGAFIDIGVPADYRRFCDQHETFA